MNWYYESGGQQQGPVPDSELDRLLAEGKITLDTLVWREGLSGWTPIRAARAASAPASAIPPMDPGLEVTRPAQSSPAVDPSAGSEYVQPGWIRCTFTGRYFPPSEIIYIEGRPYSAAAKPQVIASLQSGTGLPGSDAGRNGPSWEDRERIGMPTAALNTIKEVLFSPADTFARMKREGGLGNPLLFYGILGTIAGVIGAVLQMGIQMATMGGMAGSTGAIAMGAGLIGGIVMAPIQVVLAAFIFSGIIHVSLMIVKGARQPFEATFRALCYMYGGISPVQIPIALIAGFAQPAMASGTPSVPFMIFFGVFMLAFAIWSLYMSSIALSGAHDITRWHAAGAILLPGVTCCGIVFLFGMLMAVVGSR